MKVSRNRFFFKGLISAAMAAAVFFSPVAELTVFAASFGSELQMQSIGTTGETVLTNGVYYNTNVKDRVTENYVEYIPGGSVLPTIAYGNDIFGAATFKSVVSYFESQGRQVVAAINGDYFTMANGVATGMVIKEGYLRTSESAGYTSVGFLPDGKAMIGRSNLNILINAPSFPAAGISHVHLNKAMTAAAGLVLYTPDFHDTTKATIPTINVVIQVTSGAPTINGSLTGIVESVIPSQGPVDLPDGKVVLSIAAASTYKTTLAQMQAMAVGDAINVSFQADAAWNNVTQAIGGGEKLLTQGINVAPAKAERAPRTALGIKADGSTIFYTVDGRQPGYSQGATLTEVSNRLRELGCSEAVNLDGGGSTALLSIFPGDTNANTVNKPSGGILRNCANYILLVNSAKPTGQLGALHLYPYSPSFLAGAKQTFQVKATDTGYYPMTNVSDYTYSVDTDSVGSFDSTGVFTAGQTAGSGKVTASQGNVSGSTVVKVVTEPDSISLINATNNQALGASVSVPAGGTFSFAAKALYRECPLIAQGQCFQWSVSGNIGTIDQNGVFTPGPIAKGTGTVTATVSGKTASVSVNVASEGECLESFEGDTLKFKTGEPGGIFAEPEKDLSRVHNGLRSLKLTYEGESTGSVVSVPTTVTFTKSPTMLNFWLYGDNSKNQVTFNVNTPSGVADLTPVLLDFTGWKQIALELPKGVTGINSFDIHIEGVTKGVLHLDQLMAGYGYYVDQQAPTVTVTTTTEALTALLTDDVDSALVKENISVTYDGKPLAFTYDAAARTVKATLPKADANAHRVAVKVRDKSGNVQRTAATVAATGGAISPFIDMKGHWADTYTTYLYNQNIVKGLESAAGRKYNPNANMTRAEFSTIMVNWLGYKVEDYSATQLPFADADKIPAWALPYVKTVYAKGLMGGALDSGGKLRFNATSPITRQEVMTVIGHTQERGYSEASLEGFKDSNQIGSWALPYVKTLVAQKVVSGYDGGVWPKNPVTRAQIASIIFGLN